MTDVVDRDSMVKLCATNSELYAKTFFPKAFRQASPSFAKEIWEPLEDPTVRLVNLICFRGSSKTTRLRCFASKRIAYGISRTVLYIGASEKDAIRSVQWLRTQVDTNRNWSQNVRPQARKKVGGDPTGNYARSVWPYCLGSRCWYYWFS